ncbi:unnamed protein product, partial [Rotaria sp. Silwood1]
RLEKKIKAALDEGLQLNYNVYADFFEDESKALAKQRWTFLNKAKKAFMGLGKFRKKIERFAVHEFGAHFRIIETELENISDYEGFNECLDKFPLYKGKGTNRSDEKGDENRVYAKFKRKIHIREITSSERSKTSESINRMSINPVLVNNPMESSDTKQRLASTIYLNQEMLQFDLNQYPITLKCRLSDPYIKILLNRDLIIDDTKERLYNTLEPVFGKSYEFEVTIPQQSLLLIQIWDWDLTSLDDRKAETIIDIEQSFVFMS